MFKCVLLGSLLAGSALPAAQDYPQHKSALPSPVTYYKLPDINPPLEASEKNEESKEHEPRFGVQLGYGNDLQGYSGGTVMGNYTPLKIDLGGLVLGTVIGFGAVLLAPKILSLFSAHHHTPTPYARSEGEDMFSNIGSVIGKIDETLQEHRIDTMACLQKAACSLVGYATSTPAKQIIHNTSNPILNFLIDGSKLKAAMERGLSGDNCAAAFPHCTISANSLLKDNKLS